jgi:hypothetical protein
MMKRNPKLKRRWLIAISIFAVIIIAPFSSYVLSYQPQAQAKTAFENAIQKNGYYQFLSAQSSVGIIFYPGGLVNPIAYASFAQSLSLETNSSVFVTQPLWNLAITNIEGASTIIHANPSIDFWLVGGHSLGGSSAAFYAFNHLDEVNGLFFLASYTTEDADFSETVLPILSITGSEDQILDLQTYQEAEIYHSPFTTIHIIDGGNHSQFGDYGFQRGDGIAGVTLSEQMTETIITITTWLFFITLMQ